MLLAKALLKRAIVLSQRVPLFSARGTYSYPGLRQPESDFPQAQTEFSDFSAFAHNFQRAGIDLTHTLEGARVLDFGSGYGGRTVWYAQHALEVHGIEVFASMVAESAKYSAHMGARNCHFTLGKEDAIEYPDCYFDVVISNDVLEHVRDPRIVLREIARVLSPGGLALLVFTPYWGMFSHHLNYITLLPGVHWMLSPKTIVEAVNELLDSHPVFSDLQVAQQPVPRLAYDGSRMVLPTLNGLTKRDFIRGIRGLGLEVLFLRSTPILERFFVAGRLGSLANRLLCSVPKLDEAFGFNLVALLQRPEDYRVGG